MRELPVYALLFVLHASPAFAGTDAAADSTPVVSRPVAAIVSALAVRSDAARDTAWRTELARAREIASRERATMKRGLRATSVAWFLVAAGVGLQGLRNEREERDAYREADRLYLAYRQATEEDDAVSLRRQCIAAVDRGDRAARRRNALSAAAIGVFGVSMTLWAF